MIIVLEQTGEPGGNPTVRLGDHTMMTYCTFSFSITGSLIICVRRISSVTV